MLLFENEPTVIYRGVKRERGCRGGGGGMESCSASDGVCVRVLVGVRQSRLCNARHTVYVCAYADRVVTACACACVYVCVRVYIRVLPSITVTTTRCSGGGGGDGGCCSALTTTTRSTSLLAADLVCSL